MHNLLLYKILYNNCKLHNRAYKGPWIHRRPHPSYSTVEPTDTMEDTSNHLTNKEQAKEILLKKANHHK